MDDRIQPLDAAESRPFEAQAILRASGLTKDYGSGRLALKQLSLDILPGRIIGLVGPNGAGKTTLMRMWMGFDRPTAGSVSVFGRNPWGDRSHTVTRIAYFPQSPSLYRDLTVGDHLQLARHYRGSFLIGRAEEHLRRANVPLDRPVGRLSGGQQAQVALAMAFGLGADVWLLDEPLASLDPLARADILADIVESSREINATVVVSSHIVEDVERACDDIAVIGGGRILLHESIEDATSHHVVAVESPGPGAQVIADLRGDDQARRLWRLAGTDAPERARLTDVVLAYLSLGRSLEGSQA